MKYTVTEYEKGFYLLDDQRVRQFLFLGEDEALLVDTGFADSDVISVVRGLADKPVRVVMTHGDGDHTGGLEAFGECWIHEKDASMVKPEIKVHFAAEGDVFTVGPYRLEVLHIPGHTYGSIALLEREKGWLFPGDSIALTGPIFMFGQHRNMDLYIESLRRLSAEKAGLRAVFPCHGGCPVEPEQIDLCLEDAIACRAGELPAEDHPSMPCKVCQGTHVSFLYGA